MFVKKFEADTLEEALQAVKSDLGPDAIILKTITNKGLKGAFKKKRIEITAAISERNFEKKAKVDKVLNDDQKQAFYQNSAETMKNTINEYGQKTQPQSSGPGYGSMGLNKVVNTLAKSGATIADATTKTTSILKNSLDDFLNTEAGNVDDFINDAFEEDEQPIRRPAPQKATSQASPSRGRYAEPPEPFRTQVDPVRPSAVQQSRYTDEERVAASQPTGVSREAYQELKQEFRTQQNKIELLEKKLAELTQNYHFNQKLMSEAQGVFQLRTTLKSLGIDEGIIIDLIKKASYELTKEDLENPDIVFEFALRDMASSIKCDHPLFAKIDQGKPVMTVLVSEAASGQSSMSMKVAILKKDVNIIQFSEDAQNNGSTDFAAQVFGIKILKAQTPSEVVSMARKSFEEKKSVLIDLRLNHKNTEDIKKFVESLRRSFDHVEILCTISAIHAELYNRKILARYKEILDGVIISHVDLCMNFGSLFNVHRHHNNLPLKFFGTGPMVPDDLEGATAERLMAGLFQF